MSVSFKLRDQPDGSHGTITDKEKQFSEKKIKGDEKNA
jgi:hypothetical protein